MKRQLKKMKFAFLGATIMLLSMTSAFAQGGTTGPLTWKLTGGTLTISGVGNMPDYTYPNSPPWSPYNNSIQSVVIETGVKTIGFGAFSLYGSLTSVTISNSVTTIGGSAFFGCCALKTITTYAQNPPTLSKNTFAEVPKTIPVYIPCFSYDSYKNDSEWGDWFTNFVINGAVSEPTYYSATGYFPYSDNNFSMLNSAGTHKTTLANSTGCDSVVYLTLTEKTHPQLCMASVDGNNHNEIVWTPLEDVSSFNIYREGDGGQYNLVETVGGNEPNIWVDMESNAQIRSYRYKVSAVDTHVNGSESKLSDAHKTMYLTISAGMNNSWNLIWTAYEGTEYSTYNIYRATGATPGEFTLIGTMSAGNTSYSDFGAPAADYVYYMVEIMLNAPCEIGKALASIKSNVATNNSGVGIVETDNEPSLRIYPNPVNEQLTIDNGVAGQARNDATIENIEIFNIMGQKLLSFPSLPSPETTLDVSNLPSGMYFLKIGEKTARFVKE